MINIRDKSFLIFTIVLMMIIFELLFTVSCSTTKSVNQYLLQLPSNLELQEDKAQKYMLSVNYFTRDIYGKLLNKMKITAEYTRALPEGKVRWNNVQITKTLDSTLAFSASELQEYMENFTYKPSGEMLSGTFFKDFPPNTMETKVLIWDMVSIEVWAWNYFDKLNLNEVYNPSPDGETFEMAGAGSFQNKNLSLTWVGLSKMNNELSALIQYESLFNTLDMNAGTFTMKGRTNYWGNIWVSLQDKQIEYATLYEDGLLDMKFSGQEEKTLINVFREINFKKDISVIQNK